MKRRKRASTRREPSAKDDAPKQEPLEIPDGLNDAGKSDSPLDYMLRVMRDPSQDEKRRDSMAKAALPYVHTRLSRPDGEISDEEGGAITFTWQSPQK
jgi:hypothetical protein